MAPGAAPDSLADALCGRVLTERYRIDRVLGEGGMALVFEGHHLGLDRAIAVKVLKPEFVAEPQVLARFDREARAVSRLEHPGIVRMFDVGTAELDDVGSPIAFLVMERLHGQELSDVLREDGPAKPDLALAWLEEMLAAIDHAHGRGIVHRDLKPENVFVCDAEDGGRTLKLVDFGIAKMVEADGATPLTQVGMIFGTPGYMSPEQATGMPVDARTDLYSVGILFYEMLSGRVPFVAPDMMQVLRMHVQEPPPPLPVAEPIADLLARLLAKEPEGRYPSAAAALEAVQVARASLSAPPPAKPTVPRIELAQPEPEPEAVALEVSASPAPAPARSRGGMVALVASGVLLAGVGVAIAMREPEPEVAEAPAEEAPQEAEPTPSTAAVAKPPWRAPEAALAEVDVSLKAGKRVEARKLLTPLLAAYPNDPDVVWRAALAEGRPERHSERRAEQMLAAIELDPERLEDPEAQVVVLRELSRPTVPEALLDLVVDHGTPIADAWVRALLGRTRHALPHAQRHRLQAAAPAASEAWSRAAHLCLDLWQAPTTPEPCATYEATLEAMAASPAADYRKSLVSAPLPSPGPQEEPEACEGLEAQRDAVLEGLGDDAPGDPEFVPEDFVGKVKARPKKRRRKRLRDLFR